MSSSPGTEYALSSALPQPAAARIIAITKNLFIEGTPFAVGLRPAGCELPFPRIGTGWYATCVMVLMVPSNVYTGQGVRVKGQSGDARVGPSLTPLTWRRC